MRKICCFFLYYKEKRKKELKIVNISIRLTCSVRLKWKFWWGNYFFTRKIIFGYAIDEFFRLFSHFCCENLFSKCWNCESGELNVQFLLWGRFKIIQSRFFLANFLTKIKMEYSMNLLLSFPSLETDTNTHTHTDGGKFISLFAVSRYCGGCWSKVGLDEMRAATIFFENFVHWKTVIPARFFSYFLVKHTQPLKY